MSLATVPLRKRPTKLGDVLKAKAKEAENVETRATKPARKPRSVPVGVPSDAVAVVEAEESPLEPAKAPKATPLRTKLTSDERQAALDEAYELPYDPPSYHFEPSSDPMAEFAARELCRRKLLPFIQRFRPKYTAGWVHEDICRRIERFVKQVEAGLSPRLLLMMPPRSGKSEISSRHTPAWILGQHPDWEIIAGSHTSSLSLSFSRYLRDVMRDPAYTAVFPEARLDPSSQSVENWNLTNGGGYLAAGVGTGITGRGAHVLLLDDLVKDIEAADSLTIRDNTWEWYLSTAYTRLAPGGGVLGLMCMTGDTPVLMADGTESRLDSLKESDAIATYKNGKLKTSRVAAMRSSGRDFIYKITTTSGKIVRANQRHPFLTITPDGELVWTRVRSLTTAHKIVGLPVNGESGRVLPAPWMDATNPPNAEASAPHTTTRKSGLTGTKSRAITAKLVAQPDSSIVTGSLQLTTTQCMKPKAGAAPSAENMLSTGAHLPTGRTNSLSTTATTLGKFADCSATTVTRGLDILELSLWHLPQQATSDFTAEQIVSIDADGEEEVFDVQVDDTENFIANGLVSHNTWWHDDDWAGRIQQAMAADDGADQFEIIRYPAINDYGDEYILPDDTIQQLTADDLIPEGSRLTRRQGTAVHPARYTTAMMLRIKNNLVGGGQKRVWDALYQQNPIPDEGNFFSKEMFRYYGVAPNRSELYVYQAWDFAISEGKESDYTVGVCIGQDHRDNLYVLDVRRFRVQDGGYIVDEILDFAKTYNADLLGFEDGQIWKAIEFQFQKRCEERRQYPSFEVLKPLTDKMVRANPLKGRMQIGKMYFDKMAVWFTDLYKEMLHFPAGKHDDQIDGLAWAVRLTLTRPAPREKRCEPKVKSWKDDLNRFIAGGGGTHMSA